MRLQSIRDSRRCHVLNCCQANAILENFPYYNNYVDLTRMELSALHTVQPGPPASVAFIGSGPLPLSSICLARSENKPRVLNIDREADAITISMELCKRLGEPAQQIHFNCIEADSSEISLEGYDVVYLAALVGNTQREKEDLLKSVVARMRKGSLVVVRSADGLRRLLYPVNALLARLYNVREVAEDDKILILEQEFDHSSNAVRDLLHICLVTHPYNHIINSVIVGMVRGAASNVKR